MDQKERRRQRKEALDQRSPLRNIRQRRPLSVIDHNNIEFGGVNHHPSSASQSSIATGTPYIGQENISLILTPFRTPTLATPNHSPSSIVTHRSKNIGSTIGGEHSQSSFSRFQSVVSANNSILYESSSRPCDRRNMEYARTLDFDLDKDIRGIIN